MAELPFDGVDRPYGSAWHLLRFLGYHRELLNDRVCAATGISAIKWLDFGFARENGDSGLSGMDFLRGGNSREEKALEAWKGFWPRSVTLHPWDAVGKVLAFDGSTEWILVEARAHVQELHSSCGAVSPGSLERISGVVSRTAVSLGVEFSESWMSEYYQYASRLVVLDFLETRGVMARLVCICFCGDRRPDGLFCPSSEREWRPALQRMYSRLGLSESGNGIMKRVHHVFLGLDSR
ncbi:MAG: hypothetical protein AVO35_09710 [Candidatus Aegiribacteria sp. MLS_C]|nr:MAG: hypothetical protein AVO35_09710 [Candidatus Aegiribacteria sp. MLS_C]